MVLSLVSTDLNQWYFLLVMRSANFFEEAEKNGNTLYNNQTKKV